MTESRSEASGEVAELRFEDAFSELEAALEALEHGDLSLQDTLTLYERGVALADRCAELLVEAELRVRRLDEQGDDAGPLDL